MCCIRWPTRGSGSEEERSIRQVYWREERDSRIIRAARILRASTVMTKQNITVSLPPQTIRKAKVLAARRGSSISGLLAEQIEILVGEEESYERAERQAA